MDTFATAVEWPDGYPKALSCAGVGAGDPAAAGGVATAAGADGEPAWFSAVRGVGCAVTSRHLHDVAGLMEDFAFVRPLLGSVRTSMIHPLEVSGEVVGVAFHCGMGASTNRVYLGRDASGGVVSVLVDLDLLTGAELTSG